ncbi:MAG TPA: matrixin family metalloprotease [archaeon]|nr:matrixin family metalloprotease [archaeon]
MNLKWIFAVLAISALLVPATLASSLPAKEKYQEPLDKVTFIHYSNGKVKPTSSAPCFKLMGVKWKMLPVNYVINPSNSGLPVADIVNALSSSAEEWDSRTSANLFGTYLINYSAAWDDTASQVDYTNEYVFGPYPQTNVIAVTNIWYTRYGKQIVDYDVMFNTYYAWGDGTLNPSLMDLQNIATHETGHGLGLSDVYNSGCFAVTMYGYSTEGDIGKRTLEQPDITGLQKMYGI